MIRLLCALLCLGPQLGWAQSPEAPTPPTAPTASPPTPTQITPPAPPVTVAPSAPVKSAFNERWSHLRSDSQSETAGCTAFRKAMTNPVAATPTQPPEPSPTPQLMAAPPDTSPAVTKANALKLWPGFPLTQVQGMQLILASKNPPVGIDSGKFLDDYAKFGTCDFNKTIELVVDLQKQLKEGKLAPADRKMVIETLDQYLQMIANKPGPMVKVAVGISLAEFLIHGDYLRRLASKDRMIRKLKEQASQKNVTLEQGLLSFVNPPTSLIQVWNDMHEAERLRMELARIIFFP